MENKFAPAHASTSESSGKHMLDHNAGRCCTIELGIPCFTTHATVKLPPHNLDVAQITPVTRPAVADRVIVLTVLVCAKACQDHGVVNLSRILLAGCHLQNTAVIEQHLVRHHDADGDWALAHQGLHQRLLVASGDVDPPRDLGANLHEASVLAEAVDGEVASVGFGSGDHTPILPDNFQSTDVGVASIAARIRRGVCPCEPRAVDDKLLRQDDEPARADGLDGLYGFRQAVGPAGPAECLVLDGAHNPRPGRAPVKVHGQCDRRAQLVGAHEPPVLRQTAVRPCGLGPATAEAQDLLRRHVEKLVAAEAHPPRVLLVQLPHQTDVPLKDGPTEDAGLRSIGLAVLLHKCVKEQIRITGGWGCAHRVGGLQEVADPDRELLRLRPVTPCWEAQVCLCRGARPEAEEIHDVLIGVGAECDVPGVHVPTDGLVQDGVPEERNVVVHGAEAAMARIERVLLAQDTSDELLATVIVRVQIWKEG
mmetsp:Transcript_57495/g.171104  ORF Transcript_57495/g.171104 Transcript_57495/m.171104 type:complete len:480 (+) Transcript_57495:160-1599(+)